MKVNGSGPLGARLLIVGEAPGREEDERGEPFIGASGQELNRMLAEAGIMRSEVYLTNVARFRPLNNDIYQFIAKAKKDIGAAHSKFRDKYVTKEIIEGYGELLREIEMVRPNLILAFGNLAMYALTGRWGILKWRGSHLTTESGIKVIPTIHPAAVLRQWDLRPVVMNDLRRAKRAMTTPKWEGRPAWKFQVRPSFGQTSVQLTQLYASLNDGRVEWLDLDIETKHGHIDSFGLSWSKTDAICIPFYARGKPEGYWSADEEAWIVWMLWRVTTHTKVKIRWQNGLYDAQYIHHHWHFIPRGVQDTMISQHSAFCAMPKGLGFLGSMYAEWYIYWKDEGKIASDAPEEQRWAYNCQDCIYTREAGEELTKALASLGLAEVDAAQQELFYPVLHAMLRGVRIIPERRDEMARQIQDELSKRESFLVRVLGHSINVSSPKQMQALFYDDLAQPPVLNRVVIQGRTVMRPTCDDEALQKIGRKEPLLRPVVNAIGDIRTLQKFLNDFVLMPLDEDGRMRCSFNIAGDAGGKSAPYSYRLSSGKNAFGNGGNLQTIPSEKSKSAGKAKQRGSMDFELPNIRSMYGPDVGYTFFDMDLDRADLHPVAWEADDPLLKAALKLGADVHLLNAYIIDNVEPPPLEELVESHPRYWDYRGPLKHKREFAKVFGHATDYLGKPKTIAEHTGRLVYEIERAQKNYFGRYPGIQKWHERIRLQVFKHHFVENAFGYRWYIFDRVDELLLPKAVAWIPQSTVGIVINRAWIASYKNLPEVQVLLQVHDSLAGQFPTFAKERLLPKMRELSRIVVPYEDPLIIPTGIKTSETSWGDCE